MIEHISQAKKCSETRGSDYGARRVRRKRVTFTNLLYMNNRVFIITSYTMFVPIIN